MSSECQVLVGDVETIDDPDQSPRELRLDRQIRLTRQHASSATPCDRDPVVGPLRVVVAKGGLGAQGDEQVGGPRPVGQIGAGDESQVVEHGGGASRIEIGRGRLEERHP